MLLRPEMARSFAEEQKSDFVNLGVVVLDIELLSLMVKILGLKNCP